jgi:hypothetical protein
LSYVAFVSTPDGYELQEREGDPPSPGDEIDDHGGRFEVVKVAQSPLPGDQRRCAYLERTPLGCQLELARAPLSAGPAKNVTAPDLMALLMWRPTS